MYGKGNFLVKMGKKAIIDQRVILGYDLGIRKIKNKLLIIGDYARIRAGTCIYLGSKIGDWLETGHNVIIREENRVGNNFKIWSNSCLDYGCRVGNNVKIHNNVYVAQFTTIEDNVFIAPGVAIANDLCPACTKCMRGPTIKRGAKIGINVTLLPHILIGEYALIGAGSVVTKNVPPHTLVYGNPAKVIKSIYDIKCRKRIIDKPYHREIDK